MNLAPGTSALTRDEKILALSIMIEQLKAEQRIENWMNAHPGAVCWTMQEGLRRMCTVILDGKTLAQTKGADDDDARAQAFNVIFTNEAAASV